MTSIEVYDLEHLARIGEGMAHAGCPNAMSYARVQELALPTLDELVGDWTETRVQTTPSVRSIPTPDAIVRAAARRPLVPPPFPRFAVQTVRTRSSARPIRWPVYVCGFIAGIFGGLALLKSPVGQSPEAQRAIHDVTAFVQLAR